MKKVLLLVLALGLFTVSCEPETTIEELLNERSTEPDENCAANDTNCNGIPDNEEKDN